MERKGFRRLKTKPLKRHGRYGVDLGAYPNMAVNKIFPFPPPK